MFQTQWNDHESALVDHKYELVDHTTMSVDHKSASTDHISASTDHKSVYADVFSKPVEQWREFLGTFTTGMFLGAGNHCSALHFDTKSSAVAKM